MRSDPFQAQYVHQKRWPGAGDWSPANRWPRDEAAAPWWSVCGVTRQRRRRAGVLEQKVRALPQMRLNPTPRVPRFFFFFPLNSEGSDVKRMWVVPPGSGLWSSGFKGADHVEGYRCCSQTQVASPYPAPIWGVQSEDIEKVGWDSEWWEGGFGEPLLVASASRLAPPPRTAALNINKANYWLVKSAAPNSGRVAQWPRVPLPPPQTRKTRLLDFILRFLLGLQET